MAICDSLRNPTHQLANKLANCRVLYLYFYLDDPAAEPSVPADDSEIQPSDNGEKEDETVESDSETVSREYQSFPSGFTVCLPWV